MNKEKQQEIRGFLGWLEGYLGAKVEDLTPKTKLQSYYEHDYESFLAVLRKNGRKLAVDPLPPGAGRGAESRVRGLHEEAAAAKGGDREDGRADRCGCVPAVRTDGGDRDCRRELIRLVR